jgi:hypothetical protein
MTSEQSSCGVNEWLGVINTFIDAKSLEDAHVAVRPCVLLLGSEIVL